MERPTPETSPSPTDSGNAAWVFGYGSLVWRPDFPFVRRVPGYIEGWMRRFYQASTDHRGVPGAPGRVVTLLPRADARCWGVAYELPRAERQDVLSALDYREKNGYRRARVRFVPQGDAVERAGKAPRELLVYVATEQNPHYLGPASAEEIAAQASTARGPSGTNREYVLKLAAALREMGADDPHVFDVERALVALLGDD